MKSSTPNTTKFDVAPEDLLEHEDAAAKLLYRISLLRNGATAAIRAPWGRGKTDVLGRVSRRAVAATADANSSFAIVLAINPWKYAQADMLTPLVLELLRECPASRRTTGTAVWKEVVPAAVESSMAAVMDKVTRFSVAVPAPA